MRPRRLAALGCAIAVAAVAPVSASGRADNRALSPQMFAKVASGVALILTYDCGGHPTGQGSGFLVGKQLVMTARHVVASGACKIRVVLDGKSYAGSNVRFWYSTSSTVAQVDVATMRIDHPAPGFVFRISGGNPPIGSVLAMIGHPLGNPVSLSQGRLLSKITVEGVPQLEIWMLSAEGASGSPILNRYGDVVGVLQRGVARNDAGFILGINLAAAWGRRAERDLCKVYPYAGVPECSPALPPSPPPPPPPPPGPPPAPPPPPSPEPGHYCGSVTDGSESVCFDITPATLTVVNFTFQAEVTCTDASKWTWTLHAPEMPTLSDDSFHYSQPDTPSTSSDPSYTDLVVAYAVDGAADDNGIAGGTYDVSHMSWDRNGVHYDCSGSLEQWNATD